MAFLGTTVLAAGCDTSQAAPSAGVPTVESAKQQLQAAGQEAVQATKDYAYAARAELVKDMQNKLATINHTLQQLSDKVERSSSAAKADAKAKLLVVRDRAVQLNAELERAKDAEEAAWDQVRAGVKKSYQDLEQSVAQARTWLSEKIAP